MSYFNSHRKSRAGIIWAEFRPKKGSDKNSCHLSQRNAKINSLKNKIDHAENVWFFYWPIQLPEECKVMGNFVNKTKKINATQHKFYALKDKFYFKDT